MARIGSSGVVEFSIALVVGLLALLGGLFIVAFLLVEPIRDPHGLTSTVSIPTGK